MKTFYIGFDKVARVAHVTETAGNVPSGTTNLGTFMLPSDTEDDLGKSNRTIFHEVRDKLYSVGEQNMQAVQIMVI